MSEFKELIFRLREDPVKVKKIYDYVKSDPVTLSKMPDETYTVSDGNHRANLLNLLKVENIPSMVDGEFQLTPRELLLRPNGSIGTQGFTSENMVKLINYILEKPSTLSLFEELIEDKEFDNKIIKSFRSKSTLCPVVFEKTNKSYVMREDIRNKLLQITDEYIDFIGVEFFIHDIVLTGSLANYNWSEFSDVDLHIIIDMDEFDGDKKTDSIVLHTIVADFFDAKEKVWKLNHDIKIKEFDVELYVQDINQEHVSSGVYSILNDKWVITPERLNPKIDDNKILQKGEEYGKQIDDLISKIKGDKDITNETKDLYKKIKKFRQSGLESGGEYSYENLTFKLLRRNGYIKKLLDLKSQLIDKKLSIPQ
jgi:predicted nucleotidyltransferase